MSQLSDYDAEDEGFEAPTPVRPAFDEIRPLSVRMRDSVRAQLDVLAQLNTRSVTEETRLALEHWVERAKTDPTLKERADRVRAEIDEEAEHRRRSIDRDAEHRRQAIAAVLGTDNEDDTGDASEGDRSPEVVDSSTGSESDEPPEATDSGTVTQEDPAPGQADTPAEDAEEPPAESPDPPAKQARIQRRKTS